MYTQKQLKWTEEQQLELDELLEVVNRLLKESTELQDCPEISKRTMHYYVQQNLFPKRRRRGPRTTYPASFIYRLLFIKLLQQRGMSLGDIGAFLPSAMNQISDDLIKATLLGEEPLEIGYLHDYAREEVAGRESSGEAVIVAQKINSKQRTSLNSISPSPLNEERAMDRWNMPSRFNASASEALSLHAPADCAFCKPDVNRILDEVGSCIAIEDKFPVSEGHTLIIPRQHVRSIVELSSTDISDMFEALNRVCVQLDAVYSPDGYNIGINEGRAAGQTIMHLHLHVIPRYAGDKADPRGGIRWLFPDKAAYWVE